ncbi:Programmed cell death 1 ligand 1 [Dissostichus eleginoides]|uniref:Programmed cell death 1 ligand 1 n=1 Tax=Dissostichus eleginoides TaxID=100907 RepID=A0AAD9BMU0_DISEL|nr:Programmed cell death 1 ligand 1 [Dissostichus eleginoides]
MASNGVLLLFTFIHISIGHADFINVEVRAENVGKYGQQSLLECVYIPSQEAEDGKLLWVHWKKEFVDILFFHQGNTKAESRYSFAEPSWNTANRNVSLLITNTSVKDEGEYTCEMETERGHGIKKSRLRVTAKYNKPAIKFDPQTSTLMCESDSGYPKGQLRWFDEFGTEWTKSSEMEVDKTESGLFNLSRRNQEKGGDRTTKVVAPLVVIGSLVWSRGDHQPVDTCDSPVEQGEDQSCPDSPA